MGSIPSAGIFRRRHPPENPLIAASLIQRTNSPEVYYLHISGAQRGPYTIRHIDHLLNSGLIAQETLYWREGLEQWQPVTQLVAVREKPKRWRKLAWILGILLVLAVPARIFGPVVLVGWREANQHAFTERAAYWRARDVVRNQALPGGAFVEFFSFREASVELRPPDAADVLLKGKLTEHGGQTHPATWNVRMRFDPQDKEWTGSQASEAAVAQ